MCTRVRASGFGRGAWPSEASASLRTATGAGRCSSGSSLSAQRRRSGPRSARRRTARGRRPASRQRRGRWPGCGTSMSVPHGSVRWATPTRLLVRVWPHAVRCRRSRGRTRTRRRPMRHGLLELRLGVHLGLGSTRPSLGRLGSLGRLEQRRALIQVPGGPGPRIEGSSRHRRPADSAATSTRWKRSGSGWSNGLGAREPAGPGTATMASRAMSAMLATTLGCRTSRQPYHRYASVAVRDRRADALRNRDRLRCDAQREPSRSTGRSTSAGRSRRSAAAPGDPTLRFGARPGLAGDPDAGRPGDGRARPGEGPRAAPRRGARAPTRALDGVPALLGLDRRSGPIGGPPSPRRRARATVPGRPPDPERAVLESLVPAILEQKVTGDEARRAWRELIAAHGEPAPGPPELRPAAAAGGRDVLAALPYYAFHPFGVERRRADLIRRVAARAAWFEAIVGAAARPRRYARLTACPGSGRGPRPRSRSGRSATRTPSASATSTCRTSWPGRWPASRAATTPGCSSCSSRGAASGRGSSGCSS